MAPVTGTVTYQGKPVTAGSLTFFGVGKSEQRPASGEVKPDGTFVMETFGKGDGVLVGRARITYSPPILDAKDFKIDYKSAPPQAPFTGLVPKQAEIEIGKRSNHIKVELIDPQST